jgi:hypothetical protein
LCQPAGWAVRGVVLSFLQGQPELAVEGEPGKSGIVVRLRYVLVMAAMEWEPVENFYVGDFSCSGVVRQNKGIFHLAGLPAVRAEAWRWFSSTRRQNIRVCISKKP